MDNQGFGSSDNYCDFVADSDVSALRREWCMKDIPLTGGYVWLRHSGNIGGIIK